MTPSSGCPSASTPERNACPISRFAWLLVPGQSRNEQKEKVLHDILYWMLGDGQREASTLTYVPLPTGVVTMPQGTIRTIH
jgi:ABC-type phosphate transport system substrate-binding protein